MIKAFSVKTRVVVYSERFVEMLSKITTLHLNQLTNLFRKLIKQLKTTLLHCSRNLQFLLPCTAKLILFILSIGIPNTISPSYLMYRQS